MTAKERTMALIQFVKPDKAQGQAKEIYDTMLKNAGVVPAPLQLASASPYMLNMVWQSIQYYTRHPNLGSGCFPASATWWPNSTITFFVPASIRIC